MRTSQGIRWLAVTGLALTLLLSGCSTLRDTFSDKEKPSEMGASPLLSEESTGDYELVDLYDLLYLPDMVGEYYEKCPGKANCYRMPVKKADDTYKKDDDGMYVYGDETYSLDQIWANFNLELATAKGPAEQVVIRNHIQQRLLGASNQRCSDFQRALHKLEADASFKLGSLATTFAGAGAIVSDTASARVLSGLSGITSGIRSEYAQSYFRSKNIELITKGIDVRRKRQQECMLRKATLPLESYGVAAAMADALLYHGSCSVVKGLEEASDTLTRQQDPGLKSLEATLTQFQKVRLKADAISGKAIAADPSQTAQTAEGAAAVVVAKNKALVAAQGTLGQGTPAQQQAAQAEVAGLRKELEIAQAEAQMHKDLLDARVALIQANKEAIKRQSEAAAAPGDAGKQKAADDAQANADQAKVRYEAMLQLMNDTLYQARLEVCI